MTSTQTREFVTPAMASEWLKENHVDQRSLRRNLVARLAYDMSRGQFRLTHQGVAFDTDGKLVDGQHRLTAIVKSGATVEMWVARDVDPESMPVIDTGFARSFRDMLKEHSSPLRNVIGATVRKVISWDLGNYLGRYSGYSEKNPIYRNPTNAELLERYDQEPAAFVASAQRGRDVTRAGLGGGPATAALAHYLFTHVTKTASDGTKVIDEMAKDQAETFFDMLVSGAIGTENHPVLTLRNRLIKIGGGNDTIKIKGNAEKVWPYEILALYVRAWNFFRADETAEVQRLQISRGGLSNETFPRPK